MKRYISLYEQTRIEIEEYLPSKRTMRTSVYSIELDKVKSFLDDKILDTQRVIDNINKELQTIKPTESMYIDRKQKLKGYKKQLNNLQKTTKKY